MAIRIPNICPGCQHEMMVSQLKCPECGTVVEGSFELDPFSRLSPEQRSFCLLFIRCRGSLKEVGAELRSPTPRPGTGWTTWWRRWALPGKRPRTCGCRCWRRSAKGKYRPRRPWRN